MLERKVEFNKESDWVGWFTTDCTDDHRIFIWARLKACGFCPRIFTDKHELAFGDGFTTDYTDDHRPPLENEL
ncbi:MAG TPA: hypothetical protein DCY35_12315 [Prolixibacteraceae bacterium]|nr:hypothetical protein [Prolixibacteraceae bacterium]